MSDVWRTEGTKGEETWVYFTKGNVWYTVVVSIQAASLLKPLTPVCLDLPPKALGLFGNQCLILKDPNPKWFNNICFALNQKLILSLFINQSCFKVGWGGGKHKLNIDKLENLSAQAFGSIILPTVLQTSKIHHKDI